MAAIQTKEKKMRGHPSSTVTGTSVGKTRRYLVAGLASFVGFLVWAGGAFATSPPVLSLCVSPGGDITATATCKANQTQFNAVSNTALAAVQSQVTTLQGQVSTLQG